jgi:ribonuclease VapC
VTAGGPLVVDTSAIMAILLDEPRAPLLLRAFTDAPLRLMPAATVVELGIVAESRRGPRGRREIERFVNNMDVATVDGSMSQLALEAWRRFGKGHHRANLNFGDCFVYALAVHTRLPILCVGEDFARTDAHVVDLAAFDRR